MRKHKIGWCSMTWNPVIGCLNHCEYCYARGIAKRFWKQRYMKEVSYHFEIHPGWVWTGDQYTGLKDFKPTFLEAQFDKKFPKKPQRIFVGSMSEIYHWDEEWIEKVLNKIRDYPQHTFQFLTKFPEIYRMYAFPKNCWLGVTITKETDKNSEQFRKFRTQYIVFLLDINNAKSNIDHKRFISFEPLLENINMDFLNSSSINWVIIGAETGNRKNKVIPKREWIENIVNYCIDKDIPIYLKDSLKNIYPSNIKEFPIGR